MIKHIVMWKLKDENKHKNAILIKNKLEGLVGKIDGLLSASVGIDIEIESDSYDVVLICEFANKDDMEYYKNHKEHLQVGEFVKSVRVDRKVVDFEF